MVSIDIFVYSSNWFNNFYCFRNIFISFKYIVDSSCLNGIVWCVLVIVVIFFVVDGIIGGFDVGCCVDGNGGCLVSVGGVVDYCCGGCDDRGCGDGGCRWCRDV